MTFGLKFAKHCKMENRPKISVIIVNYNGEKWLNNSINSVANQTYSDFECIIIDNGSTDNSLEKIPELDNRFKVIELSKNTGFAYANNFAVNKCQGDWIALLNPDAFASSDWLKKLLEATELFPGIKMVGSTQYLACDNHKFDGIGDFYHISGLAWRGKHNQSSIGTILEDREVFGPCAAAAMYEKKVFLDIGGFDEKYFCYHEDVDLAFRIRLAGGKCIQKSDAVVYHVSGGISGKASDFAVYHGTRNRIWTFVKCMPVSGLLLFGVAHILLNFAFIFWSIFRKNRIKPTLRGVYDGVRGLPLIWKERKNIQRNVNLMALLKILTINPIKPLMRGDGSVKIQFN